MRTRDLTCAYIRRETCADAPLHRAVAHGMRVQTSAAFIHSEITLTPQRHCPLVQAQGFPLLGHPRPRTPTGLTPPLPLRRRHPGSCPREADGAGYAAAPHSTHRAARPVSTPGGAAGKGGRRRGARAGNRGRGGAAVQRTTVLITFRSGAGAAASGDGRQRRRERRAAFGISGSLQRKRLGRFLVPPRI